MNRRHGGLLIAMLACCLAGCGYKTSPHPAAASVPGECSLIDVYAYPGRIVLRWAVPSSNVDGSALKDVSGFKVFRLVQKEGEGCENCEEKKTLYANVDYQNPVNAQISGGEVVYTDTGVSTGNVYTYWIEAYNLRGRDGRLSDEIPVTLDEFPDPPTDLRARPDAKGIVLEWEPPGRSENVRTYRVFRGTTDKAADMKAVGGTSSGSTTFMDREAEAEKPYYYTVRSLRVTRGVSLASLPATPVRAILPAVLWQPPEKVDVAWTRQGIRICWDKVKIENQETRYNIYRSEGSKMFEKLNQDGLSNLCHLDSRVIKGRSYRYAVTAFPKGKPEDESARSASEEIKFRP